MRKTLLYACAAILLIGGAMGVIKFLFPNMQWLSFRSLLLGGAPAAVNIPLYIRVYSLAMGVLEVLAAIIIFARKKRLFVFAEIVLLINMLGCVAAVVMGDFLAIASLVLRVIPLYLIEKERRAK